MLRNIWQRQKEVSNQTTRLLLNLPTQVKMTTTTALYSLKLTIEAKLPEEKKAITPHEDIKVEEKKSTDLVPNEINTALDILMTVYAQALVAGTYEQLRPLATVVDALIKEFTPALRSEASSAFLMWRQNCVISAQIISETTEHSTELSVRRTPI